MIKQVITNDMKEAMRNKEKKRLATIRMILDRIQKKEKELLKELSDDDVVLILQTYKKQVKEEMDAFKKANNHIRVEELLEDVKIIEKYLPKMMSKSEIENIISSIFNKKDEVNKGSIMKQIMPKLKGKADNSLINQVVTEFLSKQ